MSWPLIFGGDLVWQKHLPNLIDATTSDWTKTLEKLLADHPSATFVSGHGDVASADDVRDFHDYLVTLREDVAKAQSAGKSGQDLVDAVLPQLQDLPPIDADETAWEARRAAAAAQ